MRKSQYARRGRLVDPSSLHNGHYAGEPQNMKRSVIIAGQRKSISLEKAVWQSLKEIADYQDMTLPALVATIDSERNQGKLSSAIRVFVLDFYREQLDIQNESENKHQAMEAALHHSIPEFH
jgi:predicted DNA-binding ribbon-helix-helix protein